MLFDASHGVDDERCPRCHLPVWVCRSESNEIAFAPIPVECAASDQVEKWKDDHAKKNKGKDNAKELHVQPDPWSMTGRPLVDYRDAYFKAQEERHKARDKEREQVIQNMTALGD